MSTESDDPEGWTDIDVLFEDGVLDRANVSDPYFPIGHCGYCLAIGNVRKSTAAAVFDGSTEYELCELHIPKYLLEGDDKRLFRFCLRDHSRDLLKMYEGFAGT